jgi:hypothetical protein
MACAIHGLGFLNPWLQLPPALPLYTPQRTRNTQSKAPVVHDVVAGPSVTTSITRLPDELPEVQRVIELHMWGDVEGCTTSCCCTGGGVENRSAWWMWEGRICVASVTIHFSFLPRDD